MGGAPDGRDKPVGADPTFGKKAPKDGPPDHNSRYKGACSRCAEGV